MFITAEIQSYLDVISVNIWSILISLANLLIIYLLIKKFLYKPVQKILKERKAQVDTIYAEADKAKNEALENLNEYTEKLKNADSEADMRIKEAVSKGNKLSEDIISDAHAQADSILEKAKKDIALERKRTVNELKDSISDISFDIAEKLIEREITKKDQDDLIDKFIKEMGDDNG